MMLSFIHHGKNSNETLEYYYNKSGWFGCCHHVRFRDPDFPRKSLICGKFRDQETAEVYLNMLEYALNKFKDIPE